MVGFYEGGVRSINQVSKAPYKGSKPLTQAIPVISNEKQKSSSYVVESLFFFPFLQKFFFINEKDKHQPQRLHLPLVCYNF